MPIDLQNLWKNYFDKNYSDVLKTSSSFFSKNLVADYLHVTGLSLLNMNRKIEGVIMLKTSCTLFPSPNWFSNAAIATLKC